MQPKLIAVSITAALAAIATPLHAGPFDRNEVKALAYVALPFGGVSRSQQAPVLGWQDQRNSFSYHPSLFQMTPASSVRTLMDVRYNTRKENWDRFHVGGVDALTYTTRMRADGTTETAGTLAEIPTWAIVSGVVVGAAVIHDATKKEDKNKGGVPSIVEG